MIISFSASVTGINTLLSKKFAWKINDLSIENLLDPVLNYTECSNLPPQSPLTAISSLAPSVVMAVRPDSSSVVSSCRSGSTRTSLQTSLRRLAVMTLISL